MNIFTVTLIFGPHNRYLSPQDVTRCVGYYSNLEDATEAVSTNRGEMHECRYDHIVIEEFPCGVWRRAKQEIWYRWSKTNNKWVNCEKPKKYKTFANITGFGMG